MVNKTCSTCKQSLPLSAFHADKGSMDGKYGICKRCRGCIPKDEKFWDRVDKSGECWIWLGNTNATGYGVVKRNGKRLGVHRVSYQMALGAIPDGLWVLHTCDNPSCVNPSHLFVGTAQDNIRDMVQKDRQAKGERGGTAKLTEAQVIEIRVSYENGKTICALAEYFQVWQSTIRRIVRRNSWRHVA